jgi:hypothetical protein
LRSGFVALCVALRLRSTSRFPTADRSNEQAWSISARYDHGIKTRTKYDQLSLEGRTIILDSVISTRQQELAKSAAFVLSKYIQPIYVEGKNVTPFLVGSGILLRVADDLFLITAAHVIEENRENDLYTIGQFGTTALEGRFYRNASEQKDHSDEPFDIGVLHLNTDTVTALGQVNEVLPNQCAIAEPRPTRRLHLIIGYPHTKNRKLDLRKRKVFPKTFRYYTLPASPKRHGNHGLDTATHLLLDFERRHVMPFGGHDQTAPHPAGMSGGAVWTSCFRDPKLAGILTDWKHRDSFLAVRISLAVEIIRNVLPQSAHLLPNPSIRIDFDQS